MNRSHLRQAGRLRRPCEAMKGSSASEAEERETDGRDTSALRDMRKGKFPKGGLGQREKGAFRLGKLRVMNGDLPPHRSLHICLIQCSLNGQNWPSADGNHVQTELLRHEEKVVYLQLHGFVTITLGAKTLHVACLCVSLKQDNAATGAAPSSMKQHAISKHVHG